MKKSSEIGFTAKGRMYASTTLRVCRAGAEGERDKAPQGRRSMRCTNYKGIPQSTAQTPLGTEERVEKGSELVM